MVVKERIYYTKWIYFVNEPHRNKVSGDLCTMAVVQLPIFQENREIAL